MYNDPFYTQFEAGCWPARYIMSFVIGEQRRDRASWMNQLSKCKPSFFSIIIINIIWVWKPILSLWNLYTSKYLYKLVMDRHRTGSGTWNLEFTVSWAMLFFFGFAIFFFSIWSALNNGQQNFEIKFYIYVHRYDTLEITLKKILDLLA